MTEGKEKTINFALFDSELASTFALGQILNRLDKGGSKVNLFRVSNYDQAINLLKQDHQIDLCLINLDFRNGSKISSFLKARNNKVEIINLKYVDESNFNSVNLNSIDSSMDVKKTQLLREKIVNFVFNFSNTNN